MLKHSTISKLFFAFAFAGLIGACGEMQQEYDQCVEDPSLCETTEGDAISAMADAAAAAGNSCSAASADGQETCQVTCPAHERAVCKGTAHTASCDCHPATQPPVVTPAPAPVNPR